jgi:hypothetical protein
MVALYHKLLPHNQQGDSTCYGGIGKISSIVGFLGLFGEIYFGYSQGLQLAETDMVAVSETSNTLAACYAVDLPVRRGRLCRSDGLGGPSYGLV